MTYRVMLGLSIIYVFTLWVVLINTWDVFIEPSTAIQTGMRVFIEHMPKKVRTGKHRIILLTEGMVIDARDVVIPESIDYHCAGHVRVDDMGVLRVKRNDQSTLEGCV